MSDSQELELKMVVSKLHGCWEGLLEEKPVRSVAEPSR